MVAHAYKFIAHPRFNQCTKNHYTPCAVFEWGKNYGIMLSLIQLPWMCLLPVLSIKNEYSLNIETNTVLSSNHRIRADIDQKKAKKK